MPGIKKCQYCDQDIVYVANSRRGAWYANGGRHCGFTEPDKMPYSHMPYWNPATKDWE